VGQRDLGPAAQDPELDLLTAADVAAILRCTPRTAARRLASAGVPSIRVSQKLVYWRRAEVVAYLRRLEGRTVAEPRPGVGRPALPAAVLVDQTLPPEEQAKRAARVAHLFAPPRRRTREG
jgi:hypothetical protein